MNGSLRIYSPQMSLTRENPLGGGVYHARMLRALAERGARITIPLLFRREHETCDGWTVRRIPIRRAFGLGAVLTNTVFLTAALWDWFVRRERWDIFRVAEPYYVGVAGVLFSRLTGVPVVCHVHHLEDEPTSRDRRVERVVGWVARKCDIVFALSRFGAGQIRARLGVAPPRILAAYPGVNPSAGFGGSKEDAQRALGLAGCTVLTHVGALIPRKNLAALLAAFARVRARRADARLLLVGKDPARGKTTERALRREIERLNLGECVRVAGFVDEATKARILAATDVFVFPSRMEGFGLAPVEAMAAGVPCVAAPSGALPEVIHDGETGLFADPAQPEEFAAAILRLLDDPAARAAMGARARADVAARFSWDRSAAAILARLDELMGERRARPLGVLLNMGDGLTKMRRTGQAERFVGAYLPAYAARFARTIVFSYAREDEEPLPRCRVLPGLAVPGLLYSLLLPLVYHRAVRRCRVLRVMQAWGALPAVIAKLLFGVPFVVTYGFDLVDNLRLQKGGAYPWIGRIVRRLALGLADRVIVTTPALAAAATAWARPENICLVPNGVDLAQFPVVRRAPLSRERETRCLFVGRLIGQKNLEALLRATAQVPHPVSLTLAGDGPEEEHLRRLAVSLGVRAHFAGVVPFGRMPELYREADLFVLPSFGEGQPKVLLEAFASGLPCVGTDVRGIRDVIEDGRTGLLCGTDAASIAAAIRRLIEEPDLAAALGAAARRRAEREYDLAANLAREVDLLQEVSRP